MSRIGKQPIKIPEGVTVKIEGQAVEISGPKGTLSCKLKPEILAKEKNNHLFVERINEKASALHGLYRSLINNMVIGVTTGFHKGLELFGVGYRALATEKELVLNVGFSHPVKMIIPSGITITVVENKINISGIDKQLVGETAAQIRRIKPPEPYKGKGIRYVGEKIRKKAGKSVKTQGVVK